MSSTLEKIIIKKKNRATLIFCAFLLSKLRKCFETVTALFSPLLFKERGGGWEGKKKLRYNYKYFLCKLPCVLIKHLNLNFEI